jgi:hypothetical protein
MVASFGRLLGASEAAWINGVAAALSLALLFGIGSLSAHPPNLPNPFNHALVFWTVASLSAAELAGSMRGTNAVLASTGILGFTYVVATGFVAPRIGVGLFSSTVAAGRLIGSVVLDHWGAFGADVHRFGFTRLVGVILLVCGVPFVRYGQ